MARRQPAAAWIIEPAALPTECAEAHSLMISPLSNYHCDADNQPPLLTHSWFRQHGSAAFYQDSDKLRLDYARQADAMRRWSPHWRITRETKISD